MYNRRPPLPPWLGLKNEWLQDVPEEKAVCEFDGRKERCLVDDGPPASGTSLRELAKARPSP
jgi:hypothetical protein